MLNEPNANIVANRHIVHFARLCRRMQTGLEFLQPRRGELLVHQRTNSPSSSRLRISNELSAARWVSPGRPST